MSQVVSKAKEVAYKKIWGEHSLTIGELVCFIIAILIAYFKWLGKWSTLIAFAIIFIGMALF